MNAAVTITAMLPEHADQVLTIYQHGIDGGDATFETTAPSWEAFDASRLTEHRLVALDATGQVLGWAAAVPVSDRCAYAGVVVDGVPGDRWRHVGSSVETARSFVTEPSSPTTSRRCRKPRRRHISRLAVFSAPTIP